MKTILAVLVVKPGAWSNFSFKISMEQSSLLQALPHPFLVQPTELMIVYRSTTLRVLPKATGTPALKIHSFYLNAWLLTR